MRPATALRLALAGTRTDTLRVALTALSATLATLSLLAAATVLAIPGLYRPHQGSESWAQQYTSPLLREPGLRPGVAFALLLLTIPVLALAGQCSRLGAPARDRRLAAIRLAGATPGQAVGVAATETGVASAIGAGLGVAGYLVGRRLANRPDAAGRLALPTDVHPAAWAFAAICLGLPVLATAIAAALLRRVAVTPLGVVRPARRTRAPRPWPGVLIALGTAAIAAIEPLTRYYDRVDRPTPAWLVPTMLFGGGLLAAIGAVLGVGWITYSTGRVIQRLARRPAALIAARRLIADPWSGSRTFAALLVCALFGGGAAAVRAWFAAEQDMTVESQLRFNRLVHQDVAPLRDDFYTSTMDLVDLAVRVAAVVAAAGLLVALVEGTLARRRAYASLIATGVPRGVLGRAMAWQALAPAVPAILLAVAVGAALPRGIAREVQSGAQSVGVCDAGKVCEDPATRDAYTQIVKIPALVRAIPIPVDDLALVAAGALGAVLATVLLGLAFLRTVVTVEELRTT